MIGKGDFWHDLYLFDINSSAATHTVCFTTVCNSSLDVCHACLGHPFVKHLSVLKDVLPISDLDASKNKSYLVCPLAKQRRLSFVSHNNIASNSFDLIHCDIWGLYQSPTHAGFRFFLTLVDDFSRYTCVFLMNRKSDALMLVPRFFCLVKTQYGKKIMPLNCLLLISFMLRVLFINFLASDGLNRTLLLNESISTC